MATVGMTYSSGVRSSIGLLEFDALLNENTELVARATEYPVEDGSPISDHVTLEAERLKLSGVISPSNVMEMTADGRPKMIDAKATLRKLVEERQTVTVTTGLDSYESMVLESCSIGRSNEGDYYTVDAELKKIRKVILKKAEIPPDKVSTSGSTGKKAQDKAGDTKTKAGKSSGDEPKPKEVSKLKKVINGEPKK